MVSKRLDKVRALARDIVCTYVWYLPVTLMGSSTEDFSSTLPGLLGSFAKGYAIIRAENMEMRKKSEKCIFNRKSLCKYSRFDSYI